ncbi:hypothetical protein SDC9_194450 [bioreactor metagenome]|uniref:Uncharacterized protein n=1 Tax=bioreactor metagenome TaxID=1076179 RepID=A0A645I6C1_9ZZZZ
MKNRGQHYNSGRTVFDHTGKDIYNIYHKQELPGGAEVLHSHRRQAFRNLLPGKHKAETRYIADYNNDRCRSDAACK